MVTESRGVRTKLFIAVTTVLLGIGTVGVGRAVSEGWFVLVGAAAAAGGLLWFALLVGTRLAAALVIALGVGAYFVPASTPSRAPERGMENPGLASAGFILGSLVLVVGGSIVLLGIVLKNRKRSR